MKMKLACLTALVIFVGCKTDFSPPTPAEIDQSEKGSGTFIQALKADDRKSYGDLKADWLKQGKADPAAMKKLYSQAVLQSQTILGRMGYGTLFTGTVDGRTQDAIRQYQKKNGIYESGNIDPVTYFALDADDKVLDDRLVMTTSFFFSAQRWNEYFSASGGWDYRNQGDGSVVSSFIDCLKSEGYCTEADGTEMTLFGFTSVQVATTIFQVTKWNDYEIDAENVQPCEKDQIVAIRDEKTVTMHMISTEPDSISCHKFMGDAPVVDAHLKGEDEIGKARREAVQKKRETLYQFSDAAKDLMRPSK